MCRHQQQRRRLRRGHAFAPQQPLATKQLRRRPDAHPDALAFPFAVAYTDALANPFTHTVTLTITISFSHTFTDPDAYPNTFAFTDSDTNTNSDALAVAYSDPDTKSVTKPFAESDPFTDANTFAVTDAVYERCGQSGLRRRREQRGDVEERLYRVVQPREHDG